jgi:hypothetical protein
LVLVQTIICRAFQGVIDMANQMIALQARNPQLPDPARQTAQFANFMNMARQTEAAQRQAQQAQQTMDINAAQEARAARLAEPQFAKAQSEATAADLKTKLEFQAFVYTALKNADNPDQVVGFAERIAGIPQFQDPMFQGALSDAVASMPTDPVQFGEWRKTTAAKTLTGAQQLEQEYIKQTTGTEERIIGIPKFGGAGATEVPGSRIQVAQGMQYITDDQGNVRAVPKETGGSFATTTPSAGAPGKGGVAAALQTNPGALKDGAFAKSQPGYTGASGGFATFDTPQAGIAAQENLLRGSYVNKGFNTVSKIIDRYAPQGPENSSASVSNYKKYVAQKAGVNINAPITAAQIPAVAKAMREFETGNTSGGGAAGGGAPIVVKGSGAKAKPSTEGERRFGTVSQNMTDSMREATDALLESSAAAAPSGTEYAASLIPFYGDEARKFAQSGPRQRFEGALLALLDGVTFINTGAGTSKTQEANYKNTYVPTYQDTPKSRKAKLDRAIRFIENSKAAAGVMWTPEIDRELQRLKATVAKIDFGGGAVKRSTPTKSSDGWGSAKQVGN